jgi:phosphoenolpyruvate carboxylase
MKTSCKHRACIVQVLCEDSNTLRSLLTMRQSYTAPVNFMQVEVIKRVRQAAAAAAAASRNGNSNGNSGSIPVSPTASSYSVEGLGDGVGIADWQDCLLLTVNGIAAGMRNTG